MNEQLVSDKQRVRAAFAQLKALGFVAKMNYSCCSNCAMTAIYMDNPNAKDVVTYNRQEEARAFPRGSVALESDLYLGWAGDGAQIVRSLQATGLTVEWDGSPHTKIIVKRSA